MRLSPKVGTGIKFSGLTSFWPLMLQSLHKSLTDSMCSRRRVCQPQQEGEDLRSAQILGWASWFNSLFIEDVFIFDPISQKFEFLGIENMNVGGPTHFKVPLPPSSPPPYFTCSSLFLQALSSLCGLFFLPILLRAVLSDSFFILMNGFLYPRPRDWITSWLL